MTRTERGVACPPIALSALLAALPALGGCGPSSSNSPSAASLPAASPDRSASDDPLRMPDERHLRNIRQITFGGENAEAYWSFAGDRLIMQSKTPPYDCDQIFTVDLTGGEIGKPRLVSTGKGRTTCSYFLLGDQRILYASTHLGDERCPPEPDRSQGYVWALYPAFDIFTANTDGSDLERITDTPRYDAEATVCPATGRIVFTSLRSGDLELYSMDADGGNVQQLTDELGYDGGAFYSADGKKIVYRAFHPTTQAERDDYQRLLGQDLIRPTRLDIYLMDADGSNKQRITQNGKANFAPFLHPDGKRILFSSNLDDPRGREFEIYMINTDGSGLERITHNPTFDGFPMFSPDGKYLAFASNRNNQAANDTNVFVAEWVD